MKKLAFNISTRYLISFFSAVLILVCLFSLFEFSEQLEDLGTGDYRYVHAVYYVLLTMPAKAVELSPFSAVLGSIIFLGAMSHNRELLALQAGGVSRLRICSLVLVSAVALALFIAVSTEFWIPSLSKKGYIMRANHLTKRGSFLQGQGFWAKKGNTFLNVRNIESSSIYKDIYIYSFDKNGNLEEFIYAEKALIQEKQNWKMFNIIKNKYTGDNKITNKLNTASWDSFIKQKKQQMLTMPAYFLSYSQLYYILHELQGKEQNLEKYRLSFWHKIVKPLAIMVLTLITLPFLVCKININRPLGLGITFGVVGGGLFYLLMKLLGYLSLVLDADPALILLIPVGIIFISSLWLLYNKCV